LALPRAQGRSGVARISVREGGGIVLQIGEIFGRIVGLMKQAWNLVHR